MTTTFAGATPGTPQISVPRPPPERIRWCAPIERRHATGDLAHRREQRQRVVAQPHGLVGDRDVARRDQRVGALARRREVQVGEEHLVLRARPAGVLRRDGLFHLEHQFALGPHVVGALDDGRAVGDVVGVGDRGADARAALDEDAVSGGGQLARARGRQRDAVLVVLDLFGYADDHR